MYIYIFGGICRGSRREGEVGETRRWRMSRGSVEEGNGLRGSDLPEEEV